MKTEKLTCDYCGKEFERRVKSKKSKKVYCCKQCFYDDIRAERLQRVCKNCGKEFEVLKSIEKTNASGNFCCRDCYNEYLTTLTGEKNVRYKRIEKQCPVCGKKLFVIPSKDKMYINNFCSFECRSKYFFNYVGGDKSFHWKGGHANYRGNFDAVKREYFAKKQICALCGATKDIHIHHIIPFRYTQDNSKDNLIPLCRKHHRVVEIASNKFIEAVKDKDVAKKYLNILLRGKQWETKCNVLLSIKGEENA